MNDVLIGVFSAFISETFLFALLMLIGRKLADSVLLYRLMKLVGIFLTVPFVLVGIFVARASSAYEKISVDLSDFAYAEVFGGLKKWDYLIYHPYIHLFYMAAALWLGISSFLLVRESIRGRKFVKAILANSEYCDSESQKLLNEEKDRLGIRSSIAVYKTTVIHTPMLLGVFKPRMILPELALSDESKTLLIRHELVHYKNHDLFFKRLITLIRVFQWFNPIVYAYTKYFYELSELVCDRITLEGTTVQQRSQYANLLIDLSDVVSSETAIATFSNRDYKILEKRIYYIMRKPACRKKDAVFLVGLLAVLCPTAAYASGYSLMYVQDKVISGIDEERSVEMPCSITDTYEKKIDTEKIDVPVISMGNFNAQANNQIDCTIDAKKEYRYTVKNLKSGSSVKVAIFADNASELFQAGVVDVSGIKHYVSSEKGVITTDFAITKTGDYMVSFENVNTNGESIHLYGGVTID